MQLDNDSGKDIVSEPNKRPNRLTAIAHLLIGIGVFVMLAGVFSLVGALVSGVSIQELQEGKNILSFFDGKPLGLQVFIFFSSSLPFIIAAVLIPLLVKASPSLYLQFTLPKQSKWFVLGILFVLLSLPLMGPLLELNKLIDFKAISETFYDWLVLQENSNNNAYEAMIGEKSLINVLAALLFMALLPAIAEELFFRGFLLNVFNGIFRNMHMSILFSAFTFSLVHTQFLKIIPMFFLAVVFGYAVYWSGSVLTSIAAHFLNNALAVFQLYFLTDGDYSKAMEQSGDVPLLGTILIAVGVLALAYYINKNSNVKTQNFYV
jgi:membrane protease YdiL (CAAX protease family)